MFVARANTLKNYDIPLSLSSLLVEGFYQWLQFFNKDKNTLIRAFAHIFNPNMFYVAVIDEKIVGMAAVSKNQEPCVSLNKIELQKHLGRFKGYLAYKILKKEFIEKKYPFRITDDMHLIEFVATQEKYRRMGVAYKIIEYILDHNSPTFVLEVADNNASAISLYDKLGFKEFNRMKIKGGKRNGVTYAIYMQYKKIWNA